jgi:hypothetical protein
MCKSATTAEIAAHGHFLTRGHYVGAEEVEDDGKPFAEKMPRLVAELNAEFAESAKLENEIPNKRKRTVLILAAFGALSLSLPLCAATRPEPAASAFPQSLWMIASSHYCMSATYGPDGAIYFTEFQKMRLMRLGRNGLETLLDHQPGIYSVGVDAKNRIYIGLDLGDLPDPSGKYPGSIQRVDIDAAGKTHLHPIVTGIRRPRQIAFEGDMLYTLLEAERTVIGCNPDLVGTEGMPEVKTVISIHSEQPGNGLAVRNGVFYWCEYGIYQLKSDGVTRRIEGGRIRSAKPGGEITTLADGLGRCRGLGFDAAGNLYVTTEANEKDHGNSGTLGMVSPDGKYNTVLDGLDYPQFISVFPDGDVLIPFARENFLGRYQPKMKMAPLASTYPGVEIYGNHIASGTSSVADTKLTIEFPEFQRTFDFSVAISDPQPPTGGWLKIPIKALNLPPELLKKYTVEPTYPAPNIPGPGFFEIPPVKCSIGGKPCAASILVRREHVGWRWPMTYPGGIETPASGFSETPQELLVNFYW